MRASKRLTVLGTLAAAALAVLGVVLATLGREAWHLHRLHSRDFAVRQAAAEALAAMRSARAVPRLLELLDDGRVRRVGLRSLSYGECALHDMGPAAAGPLVRALRDPRPLIRARAAEVLAWREPWGPGDELMLLALWEAVAADPDWDVRYAALDAIVRRGGGEDKTLEAFKQLMRSEPRQGAAGREP